MATYAYGTLMTYIEARKVRVSSKLDYHASHQSPLPLLQSPLCLLQTKTSHRRTVPGLCRTHHHLGEVDVDTTDANIFCWMPAAAHDDTQSWQQLQGALPELHQCVKIKLPIVC
jgi:hypothetical protein